MFTNNYLDHLLFCFADQTCRRKYYEQISRIQAKSQCTISGSRQQGHKFKLSQVLYSENIYNIFKHGVPCYWNVNTYACPSSALSLQTISWSGSKFLAALQTDSRHWSFLVNNRRWFNKTFWRKKQITTISYINFY